MGERIVPIAFRLDLKGLVVESFDLPDGCDEWRWRREFYASNVSMESELLEAPFDAFPAIPPPLQQERKPAQAQHALLLAGKT